MPPVGRLGAGALEDPSHDVDSGVMAIEEAGGGNARILCLGAYGEAWTNVDMALKYPCTGERP